MSITVTARAGTPHFKTRGFVGEHSLERCEDPGCTVSAGGAASCGRLACPSCGFSGSNLTAPDGFDGDHLARCTCGAAWIPEPVRQQVAA
jgi:hypothetical protein